MGDPDPYRSLPPERRADDLLIWGVAEHLSAGRRQRVLDRTSSLDKAINDTRDEVAFHEEQRSIQAAKVDELAALLDRRRALTDEMFDLVRRESAQRAEIRAAGRRLTALRRQRDRPPTVRRGISVRIAVDADAWSLLAELARRDRVTLASRIGGLIDTEIEFAAGPNGRPSSRRRRSPGEGDPVPRRRSLRVHTTDDSLDQIRDAARTSSISFERYLGEIAEAEAFEGGWRAKPHDAAG
ncbi:MAG: hypothetical protein V9E99_10395 [Microthrixaceae bacterium]|jgi:hypothetical protein